MEVTPGLSVLLPVSAADPSHVGHARRQALAMARAMGFSELRQGELGIIVTEAAGNIAAHAVQGHIVLSPWLFREDSGIDVIALDSGKGIVDVAHSLEDGFSTAGTAGQGLGAMTRLSTMFQIHSSVGSGTALLARVAQKTSFGGSGGNELRTWDDFPADCRRDRMRRQLERKPCAWAQHLYCG